MVNEILRYLCRVYNVKHGDGVGPPLNGSGDVTAAFDAAGVSIRQTIRAHDALVAPA